MGKPIVIISHYDKASGGGAVERVLAVANETSDQLRAAGCLNVRQEFIDEAAIKTEPGMTVPRLYERLRLLAEENTHHIMVTSEPTAAAFADAKAAFGNEVTTVLTAAAFETQSLVDDFAKSMIDIVATPANPVSAASGIVTALQNKGLVSYTVKRPEGQPHWYKIGQIGPGGAA